MTMDKTSVLIVDDSALMRNLISRIIEQTDDLSVCGTAMNGKFALDKLGRLDPDVIVLDLEMPDVDGIGFLTERKKRGVTVPVIILSSLAERGARITMDALSLGASDFIMKPTGRGGPDVQGVAAQLVEMLRSYGDEFRMRRSKRRTPGTNEREVEEGAQHEADREERVEQFEPPVLPTHTAEPARGLPARSPKRRPGPVRLVAIGVSTGGPNALRRVLPKLDASLRVPILVVQHMPAGFTTEFARSLDRICDYEVREAQDGDIIVERRILIAPGDRHMRVEQRQLATTVRITDDEPVSGHRPSVDVLFASVAKCYGNECLAVIMTGMGRDGAREIGSIYEEGGLTFGQDASSAVVYGMPRAACEAGYLHRQLNLEELAAAIGEAAESVTEHA